MSAEYGAALSRHLLTGEELSAEELGRLLDRALELKADPAASRALAGRTVALLAGCGTEKSAGPKDAGGNTGGPPTATGDKTVHVVMRDILFVPDKITARVGQTVRWTNEDDVAHTVKAEKGAKFASKGPLSKGDTYAVKLHNPGTIGYICTIHPSQHGTITVVR